MTTTDLPTADDVLAQHLEEDPAFRAEWERTALARAVATRMVAYRAEHRLSQSALARMLRMSQPAVARLELGENESTIANLRRLSRGTGINFRIDIARGSLSLSA
jgi:ribosome-binding protein aMBF1 (putative translation factor)